MQSGPPPRCIFPRLWKVSLSLCLDLRPYGDDRNPQLLLPLALRRPLNAIVIRSWDRIRRHIIRDKGRIIEIEKAALKALFALSQGKPTKTKITATIRAVGKWKDIAELYSTRENLEKAEKMLDQVNDIMSAIEKANVNVNLMEFKSLATPEDLEELVQVYDQYFRTYDDENSQPIGRDFSVQLLDLEVADLGMEFEANLNVLVSTPWDKPALFTPSLQQTDSLVSLQLHWHQLAGVHSIIRNTFTATSSPGHCTGILECDEYDCPKSGNPGFWDPTGPFHSSKHQLQNRIILVTHSSLQNDFSPGPKKPSELPQRTRELKETLYHQEYLTVSLDEAHEMRNLGPKYYSALTALKQGRIKLALTATPLLTSPKDLIAMGRLLGIPHFLSDESADEIRTDGSELRKAKKIDDDGLSVQKAQIIAVRRIQKQFFGHVLRRTANSLNWEKKTLLTIPPYKDIIGVLSLTDRETEILTQRADDAKANVISGNNTGKFQTKKFYLEYRLCVAYAKSDPNSPNPNFKIVGGVEKYQVYENGRLLFFQKISKLDPALSHLKTRKILIYSEFPSMTALLRKVLRLYNGTESLAIDGTMSFDKRTETVAEFYKPDSARVLIFSSVGSAGLNFVNFMRTGSIVVIPRRDSDSGRAHRQPQKKEVKAIHLLAENSTDILINNLARGKKDMYDAFVHKNLAKELAGLLSGDIVDAGPEDGEAIQDPINAPEKPKKRKMSRKGKGKEKAPEETAQAPEKENEDGEMDIVQNSLLENQSQPDPQAFESAPTTDVDGMDIAEDPHAFQSTDAEGMGVTEEEGELGFPTDEASLSGADMEIDFQAMLISPVKPTAAALQSPAKISASQSWGPDSSDDELLRPPPSKGSRKTTRAGNSRMVAQEKSVDTLERKSDNGTSHTPDSPQSAKSPPPKRRKTDSQTADSQTKPKVGPLVNLKKTAKPKSSRSDKPKSSRSDKPQPENRGRPVTKKSQAAPASTSRSSAGPSSTSRASTSQRPISLNQFSTRLESQSIEDEEDVPPPRHSTIPYERRRKDGSKG
ncbi:hypothetical protein BDP27DRAFT_1452086 [Rhodocollybia butyracea]|uniref:Helicase ATP-binding domain-containing protein n=2 Tax=Rhodocollybia butyracea TaxID=206335 RepID=A0A9P5PEM0_9AGAR|nr:hypothetical protein BDP27DRAFT_1452086 [Rhodocollybia butyracea]